MDKEKEQLMKAYERKIISYPNDFKNESYELINKISKKICLELEDELHQIGGVRVIDNDKDLRKRIVDKVELVSYQYMEIIQANREKQLNQLTDLYNGMSINDMVGIEYEEISIDNLNEITRKITDSLMTHINFENQNNSMYHQKIRQVEQIVKQEITTEKIETIINELEEIYNNYMNYMIQQCNEFRQIMNDIYYQEENSNQNISQNEQAFLNNDESMNQLSTQGIFDNYESENAKAFK